VCTRQMNTRDGVRDVPYDAWKIYPILHFDAPWEQHTMGHLALDVRLIRADEACLEQLEKHRDLTTIFPFVFDPQVSVVHWLLGLRVPQAVDHVPSTDVGFSFAKKVEDAIATSFVACLKILRSTPAVCPLSYFGEVGDSTVKILGCPPWDIATPDIPPRCDWPEEFTGEDLLRLPDVWSGMVNLRKLDKWMNAPFQELFFQRLSQAAKEKAKKEMRSRFRRTPSEIPEDTTEAIIEHFCQETGWNSPYGEALSSLFEEEEQRAFNIGTRIGRAVGIFEGGVHLPQLHAFLSVCLVLETLLTTDSQEVTHKLATRLAKIVGDEMGPAEKADLFKRAKKVYRERSHVVHGEKSIEQADESVRKEAFNLTRRLLQKILCNKRYLGLFTVATKAELDEFFVGLDLG